MALVKLLSFNSNSNVVHESSRKEILYFVCLKLDHKVHYNCPCEFLT